MLADQGAAEFTGYHVQYGILPGAFKQYSGRHVIFPENTFLQAPESGLAAHKGKGLISEIPERNDREPGGRIIFFAAVQGIILGDCDKYLFSVKKGIVIRRTLSGCKGHETDIQLPGGYHMLLSID